MGEIARLAVNEFGDRGSGGVVPAKLAESQMTLWWDYMNLWQASFLKMMGAPAAPVAAPSKSDKRFRHEDWEQHVLFDFVKQSYLSTARWMHGQVASVEGLEGTAGVVAWCAARGVDIVRVHDVKEMVRVVRVVDAITRGT